MKTLQDLRDLISQNDGKITIGALTFSYNKIDEADIDVHFQNVLIMWFSGTFDATSPLSEMYTVTSVFEEQKAALREKMEKKKEEANTPAPVVAETNKESVEQFALGKVEAYEKILMGRDLTIGK